jgi:methionine-rich copper-binding protein CopC
MKMLAILAFALCSAAPWAMAGPHVRATSLTEGEWVEISPFSFTIVFSEPVTLEDMWLVDFYGVITRLRLRAPSGAQIATPLPVLTPHHYRIHWRGSDR